MRRGFTPEDFTRIDDIDIVRKCYIMYKDKAVGELWHEYSTISGEEDWVIRPYWDVLETVDPIAEIPGTDPDHVKDEYVIRFLPVLVEQRTIPLCRSDIGRWMFELDMDRYDLFEFMCRSHGVCSDNQLYISRTPDKVIDIDDFEFDIPER